MDYAKEKAKKEDARERLVDSLIKLLEEGTPPWERPWSTAGCGHYNAVTKNSYNGINVIYLELTAMLMGYKDPRWCTLKQANEQGWSIKKGSKSTPIEKYYEYDRQTKKSPDWGTINGMPVEERNEYIKKNVYRGTSIYRVFNAEQIEGMPALEKEEKANSETDRNDRLEKFINNFFVPIHYGGDRAYYSPGNDSITLPDRGRFNNNDYFYSTLLHEAAHATGHKSRLDRLPASMTEADYAKEELNAEMASMFLGVEYGLSQGKKEFEQHASYVDSWLQALRNDKDYLFKAIDEAKKITSFVLDQEKKHTHESSLKSDNDFNYDYRQSHIKICDTPDLLQRVGLPNLPILVSKSKLEKIINDSGKQKANYHGLGSEIIGKLPELLAKPAMIFESMTRKDSVVLVLNATTENGCPIIAAIKVNGKGNYQNLEIDANILTSAYGKDSMQNFLNLNDKNNTLLYINKKMSQSLVDPLGLQLPNNFNNFDSNSIIRKFNAFVNKDMQNNLQKTESATENGSKSISKLDDGDNFSCAAAKNDKTEIPNELRAKFKEIAEQYRAKVVSDNVMTSDSNNTKNNNCSGR